MNYAIIDFNEQDRGILSKYIKRFFNSISVYCSVKCYDIIEDLLADIKNNPHLYDTIFYTVELHKSFHLTTALQSLGFTGKTVLIHNSKGQEIEEIHYGVIYLLKKPYTSGEINRCCDVISAKNRTKFLTVTIYDRPTFIPIIDIMYVVIENSVCSLYLVNGEILKTSRTLKYVMEKINSTDFIRSHKSCIVNLRYVKEVDTVDFLMYDNLLVPIRVRDSKDVRQLFDDYTGRNSRGMKIYN